MTTAGYVQLWRDALSGEPFMYRYFCRLMLLSLHAAFCVAFGFGLWAGGLL